MTTSGLNRRGFLFGASLAGVGAALSGCATGRTKPGGSGSMSGFAAAPIRRLRVGVVWLGMRGTGWVGGFASIPGVEVVALYAMEHGKHVAIEVPSAMTLDECWALVETSERTRRHCLQMENCCYGEAEKSVRSPLDEEESDDSLTVESEPKACANYAARRSGDAEYLVLANASRTELCVVAVNSTAGARQLAVDLKGFRALDGICRGIAFESSGKPVFSGLGFYSLPARPFSADLAPESVSTFTFPISK